MRIFIFENGLKKAPTEYSRYLVYPYSAEYSHDTALGAASVTLRNMEREETFAPGTIVMIGDGYWTDNTLDQWVIVDTARGTNHANRKHTHTLYLCDITKLLEREVIGNKTFTRSLIRGKIQDFVAQKCHVYVVDSKTEFIEKNPVNTDSVFNYVNPTLFSPITTTDIISLPSIDTVFPNAIFLSDKDDMVALSVIVNGKVFFRYEFLVDRTASGYTYGSATTVENGITHEPTSNSTKLDVWLRTKGSISEVTVNDQGIIEIRWEIRRTYDENHRSISVSLYKDTSGDDQSRDIITLKRACTILGEIARQGRSSDKLNIQPVGEIATSAMNAEITDVDLSCNTLREALDTVAGIGGCFCRYKLWYYSDRSAFDHQVKVYPISSREFADVSKLGAPLVRKMEDSIEGACSAMDSAVSNLVCSSDSGTMAEPSGKGWMSLRSEDVRVTEDTGEVQVANRIYRVEKLEVAYETGTSYGTYTADITKYLREKTEYDLLSSYSPAYPNSKAYALYYKRGGKSICGLSFELEHAFSQLLVSPAIVNICNAAFGTSYSDYGSGEDGVLQFPKLRFRVTYIPIIDARVKQTKPDSADNAVSNVIVYNQSEDYADAARYGRNIAGAAERGGQPGKTVIYKAKASAGIPSPGTLYPDNPEYTISKVTVDRVKDIKTVQLNLARHFNRLNPFIGIDSEPRLFEISEHQYVDRDVIFEEFCIIGDAVSFSSKSMITNTGLAGFANAIAGTSTAGYHNPEIAVVQGDNCAKCILPVSSFGLGRSLTFTFAYKDNYSAGDKVTVGSTAGVLYSLKKAVPYANVFGEFETLSVKMYGNTGANIDPDMIPEYHAGAIRSGNMVFDTHELASDIVVYKDSRERIRFTYQIHFVTNKGWIISPGMAEDFRMITRKSSILTKKVRLYRLGYELSRVDTTIDLTNATAESYTTSSGSVQYIPLEVDATNQRVKMLSSVFGSYSHYNKFSGTGKAWAVAYEDGKLLFGCNDAISTSTYLPDINFSFRHAVE